MKKLSTAIVLILGILVGAVPASAAWISLGGDEGATIKVVESSPARIALELRIDGFEQSDVYIGGETYARITLPGEAIHLEAGRPELPLVARSVIIPEDRKMQLRVVDAQYTQLSSVVPIPSKGDLLRTVDPETVPFVFGEFYGSSESFPAQDAFTRDPYILRDFRGVTVVFNPIRYNPDQGLSVCTSMLVELVDVGAAEINVLERASSLEGIMPEFEEIYSQHFINYGMNSRYNLVPEVGKMVIICYDGFETAMQPLVEWRNMMGIPTELVLKSAVGTTANQIKTYIQNLYNSSSDPRLGFVLLVGDGPQIPSLSSGGGGADPMFALVSGSDSYPDILVGRFSAQNVSEVQTQVQRTVDYEKSPGLNGTAWYAKGTGIASNQGPGDDGEYDNQHVDNIRNSLLAYGYTHVDQIYDPYANSSMVATALNDGRSIINYTGHGSTTSWSSSGFSNTHVNALVNDNMLPFIFSVACVNGNFVSYTCFAEAWMRATHNGVPTGAVGAYMSSINQSWNPPMCGQDEANRLLFDDVARTFGSLCFNGSCQMMDEYGSGGISMFNTWIVFGDPALRYRSKAPSALTVSHDDFIDPAATTFEVYVPGTADALCALSYEGEFVGAGVTDGAGHALIAIERALPEGEMLDLCVTAYNKEPYLAEIQVDIPAMPMPLFSEDSFEMTLPSGSWGLDTLRISNMGEPGSVLEFQMRFAPMNPGLWLATIPSSGSIPYGESMDVVLRFSTVQMNDGNYPGQLNVLYNPNQMEPIPVMLHVETPTDVQDRGGVPAVVLLEAAQPNPFAKATTLRFGLPESQNARLAVYDAGGRTVRVLSEGNLPAGMHQVTWDGRDDSGRSVATGVYFARLNTQDQSQSVRMLRVR